MASVIRGKSLYMTVKGSSWENAEDNAVLLGGHLVAINNAEENEFIFRNNWGLGASLYIGLNDKNSEGQWRWSSGEQVTYTSWSPGEPNNGAGLGLANGENYGQIIFDGGGWQQGRYWNDVSNEYQPSVHATPGGIAEIPLALSITRLAPPKEGAGLFRTSINLSAGTQASGNLGNGTTIYWKVSGITADDLSRESAGLTGSGTITNGKLDIQHSLVKDADAGEQFNIAIYSDSGMTQQIGTTNSVAVHEGTINLENATLGEQHVVNQSNIITDNWRIELSSIPALLGLPNANYLVGATDVRSDSSGNLYFAGNVFKAGFAFHQQGQFVTAYAAKLTSSGKLEWIKKIDDKQIPDQCISGGSSSPLDVSRDSVLICVDGQIQEFDKNGFNKRVLTLPVQGAQAIDTGKDEEGSIYVLAYEVGLFAVYKYGANGGLEWKRQLPGASYEMEVVSSSSIVLGGSSSGFPYSREIVLINRHGSVKTLWRGDSIGSINAISTNGSGSIAYVSWINNSSTIAGVIDQNGNVIWEKPIDTNDLFIKGSVEINEDGSVTVISSSKIIAFDKNGTEKWSNVPNVESAVFPYSGTGNGRDGYGVIVVDSNKNILGIESVSDYTLSQSAPVATIPIGFSNQNDPPNNYPIGTPSITGTLKAGSTLTIDASTIQEADNFTGYTPTYQYNWEASSNNGTTWSQLTSTDATDNNSTYTLTSAEVGKRVRGVVSYLDGYGTNEVVHSAASSTVANNLVIRGSSLYNIVNGPSWTQAEVNSVKMGGHLTTISSEEENNFLVNSCLADNIAWTGLYKYKLVGDGPWDLELSNHYPNKDWSQIRKGESTWKWANGESFTYEGSWGDNDSLILRDSMVHPLVETACRGLLLLDDISWKESNSGNVKTNHAGQWVYSTEIHDINLGSAGGYQTISANGISETPFIRRGDSAYVIVQGPSWEEAEANAVKLGGHLVTINDANEWSWFKSQFSPSNGYAYKESYSYYPNGEVQLWVGLNDAAQEGSFKWVSGEVSNIALSDLLRSPNDDYGIWQWEQGSITTYPNNLYTIAPDWNDSAKNIRGIAEIKLTPNNTPTGTPTLSGNLKVGSTLTIDKSPITDKDNYEGWTPTYSYKWEVSSDSGKTWTELMSSDAKDGNSTYKLTSAEVGKRIRGVVTYMDGYGTNETVRTAASTAIQSIAIPSYTLSTNASSVDEGGVLTSTVTTKNVADGTTLYWKLSGTGITSKDFSSGSLEGSGTVKNGKLTFSHTVASDALTEGDENITITLLNASNNTIATSTVTIKDTSKTPIKPGVKTDINNPSATISLTEAGSTFSWNAWLATEPSDEVVVTYKISDSTEGVFSNGKDTINLRFTPDNWNQGQQILIQGVDDEMNDGNVRFSVFGSAKSRFDTDYWGQNSNQPLVLNSLSFQTIDDDVPDQIYGNEKANDRLQGGSGASDIYGLSGNDTIKGGKGNDRLYGGYGDDLIYGQDGNDKIEGEQGDDYIQGDAGNDNILGGTGSDEIYGGTGDDILNGGEDPDKMYGGDGSDTYYVDNKDDYVSDSGKTGKDTIYVMSYLGSNYKLGTGLDDLVIDSKAGNVSVTGNASDNNITGNESSNSIDGGTGNDDLEGGGGADNLLGGQGSDSLNGGNGDDSLLGGDGSDFFIGGVGKDVLDGGSGIDTVDYSDAAGAFVIVNLLTGKASGDGSDSLTSIENIICSDGDDIIIGSTADNILTGGDGIDLITGGSGKDVFRYSSLVDSDLASCDWIKDLVIGTDSIDSLYAVNKGSIAGTKSESSLKVASLTETSIRQTLTASVFSAKGAAVLTYTSSTKVTQTFLALNDTRAGFQSTSDALINITGYSGSLANLAIV